MLEEHHYILMFVWHLGKDSSENSCCASADSDAATEPATSPAAERPPELLEQTWPFIPDL